MSETIVTSALLRSKAEELRGVNENFRNVVEDLKAEENALRGSFEGETSEAFHNAFNSDTIQMGNFYNAIMNYVNVLLQIADNYEKAEQSNTAIASARNY